MVDDESKFSRIWGSLPFSIKLLGFGIIALILGLIVNAYALVGASLVWIVIGLILVFFDT